MLEKNLKEHMACFQDLFELEALIENAANLLTACVQQGGKIMSCGNGGSAADSQHFAAEIVCRFYRDRIALPAISLTTDTSIMTATANDDTFTHIFSRQIEALSRPDDMLIALSTSGSSKNIVQAVKTAQERQIPVIVLTGAGGGSLSSMADVAIQVPSNNTPRIQEAHIFILHYWAERIEASLFDKKDTT